VVGVVLLKNTHAHSTPPTRVGNQMKMKSHEMKK